jgi:hypothetical protein
MTALDRTPENTNFLQPTKFLLAFNRLPTVQYFCQEVNLPGAALDMATFSTPLLDVPVAGTKLSYNEFDVRFIVDENLQSWNELYKWLLAIGSPKGTEDRVLQNSLQNQYTSKTSYYSDASLTLLTALNNPNVRINFQRMFPISISDIKFDTELSAETIITATASFRYEYFDITTA